MKHSTRAALAVACLALALVVWADDQKQTDAKRGDQDTHFVKQAATCGLAEVKAGELAQERAASPQVKKFAKQMVEDHSKANKELEELAGRKGWQLPREMDDKHRKEIEKLSRLSGEEFDREFMKCQVDAHQEAVKLFEEQSQGGRDADLKAWAATTLPTLREHLRMAQQVSGREATGTDRPGKP
jgi:putative membrane protein